MLVKVIDALANNHSKSNSTTTRIETIQDGSCQTKPLEILNQIPLQQGLKLELGTSSEVLGYNSKSNSTTTRIETA